MTEDEKVRLREDLLLEEYKGLIPQIIHWDSHFWNKSKFFLAFESVFLGGTLITLRDNVAPGMILSVPLFVALTGVVIFNLYLSYVWFRTNRRNREFLELRFRRAREVEAELGGIPSSSLMIHCSFPKTTVALAGKNTSRQASP